VARDDAAADCLHDSFTSLLCVLQVADNGYVCGAYVHIGFPTMNGALGYPNNERIYFPDPSQRTFLFSLRNAHGRAFRLRLSSDAGAVAGVSTCGALLGLGHDLAVAFRKPADQDDGCWAVPHSYQLDTEKEVQDGQPPLSFAYDDKTLGGAPSFAAAEVECFALEGFKAPCPS
jgi:hypothetical protein